MVGRLFEKHRGLGVLLAAVLLGAGCGGGSGSANEAPPTSLAAQATVLPGACPGGVGSFPNSTCVVLRIQGQGNAVLEVEVRVIEPNAAVPFQGTVLLSTGNEGDDFYSDATGGSDFVTELLAAGYRVVDRRWIGGWFLTGEPIKQQSARYAALLEWVEENVHTTGLLVVTGNSGGAAEIAYALTTWDLADLVDRVVLSSGPPFARLDWLCGDPASLEWANLCTTVVPAGVMQCGTPVCTPDINPLCPVLPASPAPGELEEDSVLHPDATLDFGTTELFVLVGANDCSNSTPLSIHFYDQVTSTKSLTFVSDSPHLMSSTAAGRAALLAAVEGTSTGTSTALTFAGSYGATVGPDGETRSLFGTVHAAGSQDVLGRVFVFEERSGPTEAR